jgi:PAS domain S-box-containing protein
MAGQLDYIHFLYGLAFVLLAGIARPLSHLPKARLPWRWLGFFGLIHGLAQWMAVLGSVVPDGFLIAPLQRIVEIISYLLLIEFARTGWRVLNRKSLGLWVHLALLVPVLTTSALGSAEMEAAAQYGPGLIGALWSALMLWEYRRIHHAGGLSLLAIAIAMAGFGVAEGLFPPKADILWADLINREAFLPAFGFPVDFISAACAMAICFGTSRHYWKLRALTQPQFDWRPAIILYRWTVITLGATLVAGWVSVEIVGRAWSTSERNNLLSQARVVASSLKTEHLQQLEGLRSDELKPVYEVLHRQLLAMAGANNDYRWIYGMIQRKGRTVFVMDSTPFHSPDHAPAGTIYADAPQELQAMFTTGKASLIGPYTRRWGSFISAYVPVRDSATQTVVLVLGVDVDASLFRRREAGARLVPILATLLLAVALISAVSARLVRLDAEVRIAASENANSLFRRMFQDHGAVMLLINPRNGDIVNANRAACQFYGHGPDRLATLHVFDITATQEDDVRSAMATAITRSIGRFEFRHRTAGDTIRDVLVLTAPIRMGEETLLHAIVHDITDLKKAEADLRHMEDQVRHTQKLESLGVLAGGIAHDFNNLLMAILGNADLAREELPVGTKARANVLEIEKAARRAAELCRQMLAYSGRGSFTVEDVVLTDIVEEMTHILEVSISKKVRFQYDLDRNLPAIRADATQLRQVVMNLITNASEAIGDRTGLISLTTGIRHCDEAFLAEALLGEAAVPGNYVFLQVSDTGCGMSSQTLLQIFEPFFTTKFTGRGLGLSATLGIVRGHQGVIYVQSEANRGSSFQVLFPATSAAPRPSAAPSIAQAMSAEVQRETKGLVLAVDDDEVVCHLCRRMLERIGFRVATANGGKEAVEWFRTHGASARCVLLDLTMPEPDGVQTARLLREMRADIPLVLMSGYGEQELEQRYASSRFSGFLQKPFSVQSLIDKMKTVLG